MSRLRHAFTSKGEDATNREPRLWCPVTFDHEIDHLAVA